MLYSEVMELFGLSKREKEEKKRKDEDAQKRIDWYESSMKKCIQRKGMITQDEDYDYYLGLDESLAYADINEADFKKFCSSKEKSNGKIDILEYFEALEDDEDDVLDFVKKHHFVVLQEENGFGYFYCKETKKIYEYDHEEPEKFPSTGQSLQAFKAKGLSRLKGDEFAVQADKNIGENRLQ